MKVATVPLSHPALLATVLAALSHELGSPLAAIKGAATTLNGSGYGWRWATIGCVSHTKPICRS